MVGAGVGVTEGGVVAEGVTDDEFAGGADGEAAGVFGFSSSPDPSVSSSSSSFDVCISQTECGCVPGTK